MDFAERFYISVYPEISILVKTETASTWNLPSNLHPHNQISFKYLQYCIFL